MTAAAAARKRRHRIKGPRVHEITPPEGVPLRFEIAGLGARFGAQITDILITGFFLVAVLLLLAAIGVGSGAAMLTLAALLFFFMRTPYYALCELRWNGQTLGKRALGLRVISGSGRSLTPYQVVVRNLMREMEVFVPGTALMIGPSDWIEGLMLCIWIAILLAVPLLNKRRQRLGDIIANTIVVTQPVALLLPDLAAKPDAAQTGRFVFAPEQLELYGAYELQVLALFLQTEQAAKPGDARRRDGQMRAIGERIRAKIGYSDPVDTGEETDFLQAFYLAQRDFLERKKLFGDARQDKFHKEDSARESA